MWRLANPRMNYDWGSPSIIPGFLGEPPTGEPVAEVWIGAHPTAPSTLLDFDGAEVPLDQAIRDGAEELLGDLALRRFGPRLPFMVKLLAAGRPLSLQVHPDARMAERGFEREVAEGISMDAFERTYKDPYHKPEIMIALGRTLTLVGFRTARMADEMLAAVGGVWADGVRARLDDQDMGPALRAVLDADSWRRHGPDVLGRCEALGPADDAFALVRTLWRDYPDDSGVLAPLLMNAVEYGPGEALFVPTGQLHAHVAGFGIEVMAASDNVIRAGLTGKFKDREALLRSLAPASHAPDLRSVRAGRMDVGVEEFQILMMAPGQATTGVGPQILVALDHATVAGSMRLRRGETVFLAHGERPVLERGSACLVHEPLRGVDEPAP